MKAVTTIGIPTPQPFNFDLTVNKYTRYGIEWFWLNPFESRSKDRVMTAVRLHAGLTVGLKVNSKDESIIVKAFGKDTFTNDREHELERIMVRGLGLNHNLSQFYNIAGRHPILARAVNKYNGMRTSALPDVFTALLLAITLQRASYGRTERMFKLIYEKYGEPLDIEGSQIIAPPSANNIVKKGVSNLRKLCRVGYRDFIILEAAAKVVTGEIPTYDMLAKLTSAEAREKLEAVRGIGAYSLDVVLFGIHPTFPVDSWSADHIVKALDIGLTSRNRIKNIKRSVEEEFGIWQSYVYDYIINGLEREDR